MRIYYKKAHILTKLVEYVIIIVKLAIKMKGANMNKAFTLAEILITLVVIGVVAVLTIPDLIQNYNEKAWATAKSVFEKRLEVATKQMNTEEKLAGYANTMDFVNELKKYIKITRVCNNNEITKCFDKQVIWSEGEEPIDMSAIKTAESFGLDWETDTVAVQFANGVNAVIAYNPNATQDPYNNQFSATSNSMAILYDISGNKNPNTNGKDVDKINVEQLAGVAGCMIPELKDTMCITQILAPETGYSPLTESECEKMSDEGYGNKKEWCGGTRNDLWAGAVKVCGGTDNMPTIDQLKTLERYLYDDEGKGDFNFDKAAVFVDISPSTLNIPIWAGQEYNSNCAYRMEYYYAGYSHIRSSDSFRGNHVLAVCVK